MAQNTLRDPLADYIATALDRLDRGITITSDPEWLKQIEDSNCMMWGVDISWDAGEVRSAHYGNRAFNTQPHDAMWLKFRTDFDPVEHSMYSCVLAHGVKRGEIELRAGRYHVVYSARVPEYCLSDVDRETLGLPKLPKAVWSGSFNIAPGVEIKCHVLDNGQRIIEEDSIVALLEKWGDRAAVDQAALREFVQWYGKRSQ